MKIRVDHGEHVIRSIGDPPNGIVNVAYAPPPVGPTFVVSSKWQPIQVQDPNPGSGTFRAVVQIESGRRSWEESVEADGLTVVEVDEVLDGCDGHTMVACYMAAASVFMATAAEALHAGKIEVLIAALEFQSEIRQGMVGRAGEFGS
jgi:hypothetical protein